MANNNVRFFKVAKLQTYLDLAVKDANSLYWVDETQSLYLADKLYGTSRIATEEFAGLLSPEDYVALKALISAGSGLSSLTAIDGTMNIVDTDAGKAIGVAIAPDAGNQLVAVDGGLFVPAPVVPEYSIEKVTTETGFSASYKLKKTVDGEDTYVGDTINIGAGMVLQGATLETVTEENVPYEGAAIGDPYIDMAFNDAAQTHIYIPVKGLVDSYTAGEGIEIVDGKISVKLATETHGLVAVNGELKLNLATQDSDGALSKEDKVFIDTLRELNISGEYATKEEVQAVRESVAQIEQSYSWLDM